MMCSTFSPRAGNCATTIANTVTGVLNVIQAFKDAGAQTALVRNLPDFGVIPRVTQLEGTLPGISAKAEGFSRKPIT